MAARQRRDRGHRHHLPRRAPVPARHPGAHPRPAHGRALPGPDDPAAVLAGVLGRRHLRRRAAVPRRGSVGAAGEAARGGAEHLPADAAARAQHGRLHAVPDERDAGVRGRGGPRRHRHLPHLRLPQRRRRRCGPPSTRCGRPARPWPRWRCATPPTCPTRPRQLYTLDYYLRLAERDRRRAARTCSASRTWPACCARPPRPASISALRREFDLPIHLHTHDTPGGQLATYLAAIAAGVDAIDGASAPLAGTTSQPSLSSIVAATDHTPHATGLDLQAVCDLEPYWEAVRRLYAPFESGLPSPTGRVYRHEIPGGQLSNLRQQAIALGLGDRFEDDRGHLRGRGPDPRPAGEGDAVLQSGR